MAAAVPTGTAADSKYLNVWVHFDYMVGPGYSDAPTPAAIQTVVDAFKAHGVTLHIDPQHTAIPARRVIIPDWQSAYGSTPGIDNPSCTGPDAVRYSDLKDQYFRASSNHPWHYAIFGDYVFTDSAAEAENCPSVPLDLGAFGVQAGMGGDSQVGFLDNPYGLGYSFVVAMQPFRDDGGSTDPSIPLDQNVAAIFMHELGHNLGLCHGGPSLDDLDHKCPFGGSGIEGKPNYLSVMNPDFEYIGIPYAATPGSTTIAGYRIDYSDTPLPDLNESSLDESVGLQESAHPTDISFADGINNYIPASGPIDWNQNGNSTDTGVQIDLNSNGVKEVLHGADDWAWLHSRLTPPAVTALSADSPTRIGTDIRINGLNLMLPATVTFAGGISTRTDGPLSYDVSPKTGFAVTVPAGARSGPVTVATAEGKATSSQSLTITP